MALTANALSRARQACLASGMGDYLAKPLQSEGLKAILNRFVPALVDQRQQNDGLSGALFLAYPPRALKTCSLGRPKYLFFVASA
ncbi:MAG: YesN/AraC family two-component response regulator [Candidatus Pseudothioglobus sp.]|jgi:YesN/AraC family two-component response regulator